MKLDEIIEKYGMHELDIDFCQKINDEVVINAYCHQHNIDGKFMVNHYLQVSGKFNVIEENVEDKNDVFIHIANIVKKEDGTYEIGGAGDWLHFSVESDLIVTEIDESEYSKVIAENKAKFIKSN